MDMFSFHWLLCNMVAFTVLSYSEVLLRKVFFAQMRGPTKQAIKYKDLVKQDIQIKIPQSETYLEPM